MQVQSGILRTWIDGIELAVATLDHTLSE
jgi:hypothetical protein